MGVLGNLCLLHEVSRGIQIGRYYEGVPDSRGPLVILYDSIDFLVPSRFPAGYPLIRHVQIFLPWRLGVVYWYLN